FSSGKVDILIAEKAAAQATGIDCQASKIGMKIAYVINRYPAPSHSFIRREIAWLRKLGINVEVFSIRRFSGMLSSPADQSNASRTQVIIDGEFFHPAASATRKILSSPRVAWRALTLAIRLGRRSDRGILRELAWLIEACVLERWLTARRVSHV